MKKGLWVIVGITALLTYPILYPGGVGGWASAAQIYAALAYYPAAIICSIGVIISVVHTIRARGLSSYAVTLFALSLVFPLALIYRATIPDSIQLNNRTISLTQLATLASHDGR